MEARQGGFVGMLESILAEMDILGHRLQRIENYQSQILT